MDPTKTKTSKKEKALVKSEVGCCVKDELPEVEAADCAIDVSSHLSNGIDFKENVPGTENMGMFSGTLETETTKPIRNNWMKSHIEQSISEEARKKIAALIEDVGQLSDIEKLFLYLQLPTGTPVEADPLKQKCSGNPLGKKADAEVAQTYTWIQSHLEEDPETSLPKQEVYEEYRSFFEKNKIEPLCAADFGKVMKHVFPSVRPRRLGTRGNSRYCYSGLRKKCEMKSPTLPDLLSASDDSLTKECPRDGSEEEVSQASWLLVREWAEKVLSDKFPTVRHLARHLVDSTFVDARSMAAVTVLSAKTLGTDKASQATSSTPRGPGKRREAQQQLQRKLQEKKRLGDQKRKLTEQRSHSAQSSQCSTPVEGRSQQQHHHRRVLAATPQCKRDQASPSLVSSDGDVVRRLKEEPTEPKLHTSAPAANNIIFVPTVQSLQLGTQDPAVNSNGAVVTAAAGCKYKKIQPKPAACRSTAVVLHFSREAGLAATPTAEVVPSSQSPVVVCADPITETAGPSNGSKLSSLASSQVSKDGTSSSSLDWDTKLSTEVSVGTMKRHSEEGEALLCKRRHTEDGSRMPKLEAANLDLLLPTQGAVKEEMCVVHLEKEVLNEYYGNSSYDTSILEKLASKDELSQGTVSNEVTAQAVGDASKAHCAEHKTAQLSQLRMLLERNLPISYQRKDSAKLQSTGKHNAGLDCSIDPTLLLGLGDLKNGTTLKQVTVPQNNASSSTVHWKTSAWTHLLSKSTGLQPQDDLSAISLDGLVKLKDTVADTGNFTCDTSIQTSLDQVLAGTGQVSVAPVPCSPSTRGRFFTPISPQTTPHPEGILPSLSSPVMATSADMVSVAVGTSSQPPSATSSPFVSPRGTPVPWTRSRHSSGQSGYGSTPRQTPFQSVDSGVSSVSGSPFVSPQSTPVTAGRVRHNASYNPSKAVTFTNGGYNTVMPGRARHSSGPGGPPSQLVSPRSAPLSPMVGESGTQTSGFSFPAVGETPTLLRSRHNSASSIPPPSPQSAPLSPLVSSCPPPAPSLNDCSSLVPSDTDSGMGQPPSSPSWMAGLKESIANATPLWASSSARQRHASGPVLPHRLSMAASSSGDPLAHEIQEYFKNTTLVSGAPAAYRSRSVPVHQMLLLQEEMESQGPSAAIDSFSKSYPATPSMGQCFSFPQQPAAAADPLTYTGTDALAQQEDVFLASDWNSTLENEPAMKFEDNDDFDAELQSTLEDLKDCDEFSKFAKELDFNAENEDDEMT